MRRLGLLAALLGLVGCSAPGPNPANRGGWSFTDDLGRTVTLDVRPARVAGLTDVVASLWNYGIAPIAALGYTGVTDDRRFAGRDLSGVTEPGTTYGRIDLEAPTAAWPDVIVTHAYLSTPQAPSTRPRRSTASPTSPSRRRPPASPRSSRSRWTARRCR